LETATTRTEHAAVIVDSVIAAIAGACRRLFFRSSKAI